MSMPRQLVLTVPVLLVLCLTLGSAVLAAPPDRNRSEVLGGAGGDRFFTAIQSDGTILFGGLKDGVGGLGDAWLYTTDLDGNPLVDLTYRSMSGRPAAISALATGDGLLAGGQIGREGFDLDVFVMRLAEDGHIVWQASFELAGDQMLGDLVTLSDGGALIVGDTLAPDDDRTDAWVVRLDATGAIRWQKVLGSLGDDELHTAVETATGDLLLAGQGGVGRQIDGFQGWVVSLDADGNLLSHQGYELGQSDRINKLIPVKRGYIGFGVAFERSFQRGQAWILELDETGGFADSGLYGDFVQQGLDEFVDGVETSGGGFIAVGNTDTVGLAGQQFMAIEFDNRGDVRWVRPFGDGEFDVAAAAVAVRGGGGGLLIAGSTQSLGAVDALQLKTATPPPNGWSSCDEVRPVLTDNPTFIPQMGTPFLTIGNSDATLAATDLTEESSPTSSNARCSF